MNIVLFPLWLRYAYYKTLLLHACIYSYVYYLIVLSAGRHGGLFDSDWQRSAGAGD